MEPTDLADAAVARILLPSLLKALGAAVEPAVEAALARALPSAIRCALTPEFQTRQQAADYLGRSVRSVDRLRTSGQIAYTKRGGRVVIATVDLDGYLRVGRVPMRQR